MWEGPGAREAMGISPRLSALFSSFLFLNLFFIDIVELYKCHKILCTQSIQTEKKANLNILTRLKHAKDPMILTLKNNMLMVSNLPTLYHHKNVSKIQLEIWWT